MGLTGDLTMRFIDKEYWGYILLLRQTATDSFCKHFDFGKKLSEPIAFAVLGFISSIGALLVYRKSVTMSDVGIIAISTILPPILYVAYIFLTKLVFASYEVFKQKQNEIEKHQWGDKVEFSIDSYSIGNVYGDALVIKSKKKTTITSLTVEVVTIQIDREVNNLSEKGTHRLGHIKRDNIYKEVKIIEPSDNDSISNGEVKEYPITHIREASVMNPLRPHSFLTYPDKIEWCFLPSAEDGSLDALQSSMSAIARAMNGEEESRQPRVVIQVEIKGEIKLEDETITLPRKKWDIEVFNTGELSFL